MSSSSFTMPKGFRIPKKSDRNTPLNSDLSNNDMREDGTPIEMHDDKPGEKATSNAKSNRNIISEDDFPLVTHRNTLDRKTTSKTKRNRDSLSEDDLSVEIQDMLKEDAVGEHLAFLDVRGPAPRQQKKSKTQRDKVFKSNDKDKLKAKIFFPDELWTMVFHNLEYADLKAGVAAVCKNFRLITASPSFDKILCRVGVPFFVPDEVSVNEIDLHPILNRIRRTTYDNEDHIVSIISKNPRCKNFKVAFHKYSIRNEFATVPAFTHIQIIDTHDRNKHGKMIFNRNGVTVEQLIESLLQSPKADCEAIHKPAWKCEYEPEFDVDGIRSVDGVLMLFELGEHKRSVKDRQVKKVENDDIMAALAASKKREQEIAAKANHGRQPDQGRYNHILEHGEASPFFHKPETFFSEPSFGPRNSDDEGDTLAEEEEDYERYDNKYGEVLEDEFEDDDYM